MGQTVQVGGGAEKEEGSPTLTPTQQRRPCTALAGDGVEMENRAGR